MKLVLDAHLHSIASGHAYSTITEYIAHARNAGLQLIAVTEHAPAMPNSVSEIYFTNFQIVPETIEGVRIMLGVELNILDKTGAIDLSEQTLSRINPVIASLHPPCYKYSHTEMTYEEKSDEITNALFSVMDNKYIQILGHPGDPQFPFDIDAIVEKAVATHTLIEINNASLDKNSFRYGSRENMLNLLKVCKKADCPIIVSSDAHFSSLAGKFDDALELLGEADFPEHLVANVSVERFYEFLYAKNPDACFPRL